MRIGLIACAELKERPRAPVQRFYADSIFFCNALRFLTGRADAIYVLSAAAGLSALNDVVGPTNGSLLRMPASEQNAWARLVMRQLKERHGPSLRGCIFEMHTNDLHRKVLKPWFEAAGAACIEPLPGELRQQRRRFYEEWDSRAEAAGAAPQALRVAAGLGAGNRRKSPGELRLEGFYPIPLAGLAESAGRERGPAAADQAAWSAAHGVYAFFDTERCLYVGRSTSRPPVEQAIEWLVGDGRRTELGSIIHGFSTNLLVCPTADATTAERLALFTVTNLEPVLNNGYACASPDEWRHYGLQRSLSELPPPRPMDPGSTYTHLWLAGACLHQSGLAAFSAQRLARELERRFGNTRPEVEHCIANACTGAAPVSYPEHNYLVPAGGGEYRLWRPGDPLHPTRSADRTRPAQADIPAQYRSLWLRWRG